MKQIIYFILICLFSVNQLYAQLKKDGTPDMRYSANKQSSISTSRNSINSDVRYQSSYTKDNGVNVNSHYKTNSNSTNHDNFSTKGNTNPYTGKSGSKAKDYSTDANNYGSGKTIQTGERGGQYYINSNGNKTYVPKR